MFPTVLLLALIACTPKHGDTAVTTESRDTAPDDTDGSGDSGDAAADLVVDASATVHSEVATVLWVDWTQSEAAEVYLEFTFGDEGWLTTPAADRAAGAHREALLGVPADTEVTFQLVASDDESADGPATFGPWTAATGPLPDDIPVPTLLTWDERLTTEHPWVLGSVAAEAGRGNEPYWVVITDRLGRIVWYREPPYGASTNWPRVALDGTHLIVDEANPFGIGDHEDQIRRMSLDLAFDETWPVPMGWIYGESEGGGILYDQPDEGYSAFSLVELRPDGELRTLWDCTAWIDGRSDATWGCGANSIIWNPDTDTILWSMFDPSTVAEIDRQTGTLVRYFGQIDGGWAFDPPGSVFDLQHWVHYTPEGTILASTHLVDEVGVQRAHEYRLDADTETLELIWSYGEGVDRYASGMGEVTRYEVADGSRNALINYGPQGYVREVTAEGELAWELDWDRQHLNGHSTLIADLYAINEGWSGREPDAP